MFRLFGKKKHYEQAALAHYQAAMTCVSDPVFYSDFGVPDTMDGRFDLLALHLFPVMHVCVVNNEKVLAQEIFDTTFHHFDQALRQLGIGDMGVPKRMKRLMKAFNGRMHAYEAGWTGQDLAPVVARNLYSMAETPSPMHINYMTSYLKNLVEQAEAMNIEMIRAGKSIYGAPAQALQYGT